MLPKRGGVSHRMRGSPANAADQPLISQRVTRTSPAGSDARFRAVATHGAERQLSANRVGYLTLIIYVSVFYLKPWEQFPVLQGYPYMNWLAAASIVASGGALLTRSFVLRAPQVYLMAAFVGMAMASTVLAERWLGGFVWTFFELSPIFLVLILIVLHMTSLRRLRSISAVLIVLACAMVVQGLLAYGFGVDEKLFIMRQGTNVETPSEVARLRYVGVLSDPNDLAQFLLSAASLLPLLWTSGRRLGNTVKVLLPAALLLSGIYLTRSRGALVGLAVLVFLLSYPKLGRKWAITASGLALVALLLLNFSGGRAMSAGDSSAQGRIAAWSEGLQMVKSSPLWGVGYNAFSDHNDLVAHNSFVHCFAELGLVGYFLWLALITTTMVQLKFLRDAPTESGRDAASRRAAGTLRIALFTFLATASFLSRTYTMTLYILLGLGVALIAIGRQAARPVGDGLLWRSLRLTAALVVATVTVVYVAVLLLL